MEEARKEFADQDYFAARDLVISVLQDDGSNAEALELLAHIQLAMGLGQDVLGTLDRLEASGGGSTSVPLLAAEAHLQVGNLDEVQTTLEGQESAEAWRLRALAAGMDGDNRAAIAAFAAGHNAPGDKRKLFSAEASYHLARGDADAARFAVGRAQQLAPDSVETLFVSARLAELDNRPDMAARAYLAILDIAPNDRPALLGAIEQATRIERLDIVRSLVARGREAYPQDVAFLYHAANLLAHDNDWNGARDLLQQYETQLASYDEVRALYGRVLLELGQLEQARRQLAPVNRRYPDNAAYARILARILIGLGEHAQARQVMQPIVARADADPVDFELAEEAARAGT